MRLRRNKYYIKNIMPKLLDEIGINYTTDNFLQRLAELAS